MDLEMLLSPSSAGIYVYMGARFIRGVVTAVITVDVTPQKGTAGIYGRVFCFRFYKKSADTDANICRSLRCSSLRFLCLV